MKKQKAKKEAVESVEKSSVVENTGNKDNVVKIEDAKKVKKEKKVKAEKPKRRKIDKRQLTIKIVAGVLAAIFIASMFTTGIYYILSY
jgi:hypothetical protein